jgi:predicted Zn-dependent protease
VTRRATALLILLVACGNIGSPEITSSEVYSFSDVELGTTLVFHWPRSALPVRIWVASGSPLAGPAQTAIDRWQGAFLYGEFRATIVADSNVADVIVRNDPPDVPGGLGAFATQCVGETQTNIDPTALTATLPMHIFVYAVVSDEVPGLATCYSITMTHELGHALGLINSAHAGALPTDVMYANPVLDGLSDRDRLTAVTLYSIQSGVTLTGRR